MDQYVMTGYFIGHHTSHHAIHMPLSHTYVFLIMNIMVEHQNPHQIGPGFEPPFVTLCPSARQIYSQQYLYPESSHSVLK